MTGTVQSATSQIQLGDIPGPVLALVGVVIGAVLTFMFQQITWARQKAHEREKEKGKLLREKGEELHSLISIWHKYINKYHISHLSVLYGAITEEQRHDVQAKESLEPGMHDRLETLLLIYFPDLEANLIKIRKSVGYADDIYRKAIRDDLSKDKALHEYESCTRKADDALHEINVAIRGKLKNI